VRTIAIINQKGGSGKTTTAINLAASISRLGHSALLVDLDPQSHCALGLGIPESQIDLQIGDALLAPMNRAVDLGRMVWGVSRGLDLIPSATKLAAVEAPRGGLADLEDRESRLTWFLARVADQYDLCILDCPPSIGLLTFNALRAATEVLIPVETGYFALQGAAKQINTIKALCRRFGIKLPFRVVATIHDPESGVAREILAEMRRRFARSMMDEVIRADQRLREAASLGVSIHEHDALSTGAADFEALALSIAGRPATEHAHEHATDNRWEADIVGEGREVRDRGEEEGSQPAGELRPGSLIADRTTLTRVAPPRCAEKPMTRAAELAARARVLSARSVELSRKLEADPDVAQVLRELDSPEGVATAEAEIVARGHDPRIFGVHHTRKGIVFIQPAPPEATVCLAGDHNNWSATLTPLRYNHRAGVHEVCLALAPGRFRYRLVINGHWSADPYNPISQPNPFGERDSVVEVSPLSAIQSCARPAAAHKFIPGP